MLAFGFTALIATFIALIKLDVFRSEGGIGGLWVLGVAGGVAGVVLAARYAAEITWGLEVSRDGLVIRDLGVATPLLWAELQALEDTWEEFFDCEGASTVHHYALVRRNGSRIPLPADLADMDGLFDRVQTENGGHVVTAQGRRTLTFDAPKQEKA